MSNNERQSMKVDIVCVGFGPATAGFLSEISKNLTYDDGSVKLSSRAMPGMPLQIICYERSDDIGFGVSGVVSKAHSIRQSYPDLNGSEIPLTIDVKKEKLVYLLDPHGASSRSAGLKITDKILKLGKWLPWYKKEALELPVIPSFLQKHDGLIFSMGQFSQWAASRILGSGMVQLWPGMPVDKALFFENKMIGVQMVDQGTDKKGEPADGYMPGMQIEADLTVLGDGPVGNISRQLDEKFGLPDDHQQKDWAVGMKMVIELPAHTNLKAGTVFHTFGYPEPEIFGFLYVHPENIVSVGIFVPSWYENPVRTAYRYLQQYIKHPYFRDDIKGGKLKSWGAKSIQESGKRGEPHLAGNGWARIGEGSASTNILTNSGVDEAWETGVLLAQAVEKLAAANQPFTQENLEKTYVNMRRKSHIEEEAEQARHSRDGFHRGFIRGLIGMGLTGLSKGKLNVKTEPKSTHQILKQPEDYFKGRISKERIAELKQQAFSKGLALNDLLMQELGWPEIEYDGQLFMSHQDALLVGGKVQAPNGYRDHVVFLHPHLCKECDNKICIEMCSGQAITPGEDGVPNFDNDRCIHCGACMWNCVKPVESKVDKINIDFQAGAGGLHSAEN
ncbi:4Fe-4S ferredoxin [candidate division KSB1 bacterium]|nr:4Fe-4S ferredoxin [candidate division KSB1 bacterium]